MEQNQSNGDIAHLSVYFIIKRDNTLKFCYCIFNSKFLDLGSMRWVSNKLKIRLKYCFVQVQKISDDMEKI